MRARHPIVTAWLADLAVRVSPTMTPEQVEILCRDFAKGLTDLPEQAFDELSREAAAREFRRFPPYALLRKFLEGWVKRNVKPDTNLLPPVHDPNLSDIDRAHVRSWINLRPEGNLERRLARYRDNHQAAYRYILRTDAEAAAIARQRGWVEDGREEQAAFEQRLKADWGSTTEAEIGYKLIELEKQVDAGLSPSLAAALLSMLRAAVEKYAPQHLGLIPDTIKPSRQPREASARQQDAEAAASARAQMDVLNADGIEAARQEVIRAFEAQHGRKPGQLTEAMLTAIRNEDPNVQKARQFQRQQAAAKPPSPPPPAAAPATAHEDDDDAPYVPGRRRVRT
jgi:hypothetical protein